MSDTIETLPVQMTYSLPELTALLVKHKDFHEGHYELAIEIQIGVGVVGPDPETALPGAVVGFKSIGIRKVDAANPLTVDAAVVNPIKPKTTKALRRKSDPAS